MELYYIKYIGLDIFLWGEGEKIPLMRFRFREWLFRLDTHFNLQDKVNILIAKKYPGDN